MGKIKGAPLCVRIEQRKVLKVANRSLTPLISVNLDIRRLRFARAWQILLHALIDLITLFLVLKAKQERCLLWLACHPVHLEQFELETDLEQLEAPMKELCKVRYLVIDHLLVV